MRGHFIRKAGLFVHNYPKICHSGNQVFHHSPKLAAILDRMMKGSIKQAAVSSLGLVYLSRVQTWEQEQNRQGARQEKGVYGYRLGQDAKGGRRFRFPALQS